MNKTRYTSLKIFTARDWLFVCANSKVVNKSSPTRMQNRLSSDNAKSSNYRVYTIEKNKTL